MKSVDLAKFDNSWYKPAGPLRIRTWSFFNCLFFINPLFSLSGFKVFLLKLFGAKVGDNVLIKPSTNIKYPWFLHIGNKVWIGEGVWIDNLTEIHIHDNVCVSQGALLLCGNHNYKSESFDLQVGKIILEKGVWVGAKAVVCPGVTMRSHSILTVGSVMQKDTEPYTIYQGNPAVPIRKRELS